MDRLLSLRKSVANSTANSSMNSELGYESALDDTNLSIYYSINDSTSSENTLNESGHSQVMVEGEMFTVTESSTSSSHHSTNSVASNETNSYTVISNSQSLLPTSIEPIESSDNVVGSKPSACTLIGGENALLPEPILSSNSDVAGLSLISNLPPRRSVTSTVTGSENSNLPIQLHTGDAVETVLAPIGLSLIPNLPHIPALSTMNSTANIGSSSTVVQELYVLTVNTQQQTSQANGSEQMPRTQIQTRSMRLQNHNPYPTRGARYTMVQFQRNDTTRRHTTMSRQVLTQKQNENSSSSTLLGTAPSVVAPKNNIIPQQNHECEICKKTFLSRATLLAHKTSHQNKNSSSKYCKYCDRKFQKDIALANHLKENCDKIPAAARKKILTREFNERK